MKAFLKNIILIGHDGDLKRLGFDRGLNIITGDSKTGKSALIEIVDFCLFSNRSTIPVGKVTDFTDIFCCVFEHNNKKIIIGRSNNQPTKCYFSVEYSADFNVDNKINSNYFKSKKTRTKFEVQKDFEEHLGLSVEDTSLNDDDDYKLKKGKVSIRNATSLFFQHQNLIANKHSLFYRFDNFIKSRTVIDQFPIFMGWVDSRYYRLKKRSEDLEKQIKKIEAEEKKALLGIQEKREKLLIPIRQYYRDFKS
ncbi:AAA family ATPase [Vibrio harveyi]|uniref:ATP-binding protein n=1 Tax=Vibrio harveyi TaxID=669 RepID=UPI003CF48DDC